MKSKTRQSQPNQIAHRFGDVDPGNSAGNGKQLNIEPPRNWQALDLREMWHYRELLYFLTWRDVKVRYKQTAIGAAWAILQPFLSMVVFSIFFGALREVPARRSSGCSGQFCQSS